MTYHRSPLSGHGHPPWGPEGGAWWRYDQGWTPNIQGPWYAGGANIPSGELFLQTIPSPADISTQQDAQQAMLLSRQAITTAEAATAAAQPQALWVTALNWVKDHPFIAGGAIIVVAMAAQRHGMISNGRKRRGRGRRRNAGKAMSVFVRGRGPSGGMRWYKVLSLPEEEPGIGSLQMENIALVDAQAKIRRDHPDWWGNPLKVVSSRGTSKHMDGWKYLPKSY